MSTTIEKRRSTDTRRGRTHWRLQLGEPFPLGAASGARGTNFSIFSEVAERVQLGLFDEDGRETRVDLPERTAYCWHEYLAGIKAVSATGFASTARGNRRRGIGAIRRSC